MERIIKKITRFADLDRPIQTVMNKILWWWI